MNANKGLFIKDHYIFMYKKRSYIKILTEILQLLRYFNFGQ